MRTVIARHDCCSVCGGLVTPIIDLPELPLTDTYCRKPIADPLPGIDQRLLYCQSCGHGQLETLIAPAVLYGSNYCFRTSTSTTACKGTEFFLSVIGEVAPGRRFRCALDLGCNDLFLLNLLKDRAEFRVGIDPVWQGREEEREDKSIQVFGMNFEDVDLGALPTKPDLIVCRHTLEHIIDPRRVVKALMDIATDDALFVFEVPGFDGLIQRFRFDQVFHQHAQYFTFASFLKLLETVGGRHLLHRYNYHDWGAMAVAFVRGDSSTRTEAKLWSTNEIINRYRLFQRQMLTAGELLDVYSDVPLYGYGAAQMLPVLGYHMGTDFSELIAVLDDDKSKDGVGYWNLPVKVMSSSKATDFHKAAVLITAVDNVQPIMTKLLTQRPRHIIHPLNII
jgi:SAM-dependent methyltransferase